MKTKMFRVVVTLRETKNIEDIHLGINIRISTKMNHGFVAIMKLTRPVREAI